MTLRWRTRDGRSSSRATSCREHARTLPARFYTDPRLLRARDRSAVPHACGSAPAAPNEIARAGPVRRSASSPATASSSRATRPAACTRSTTSAGTAARGSAPSRTGQFAGSIQCPYHAWTYDLDGRLIGAPHMDEVPHFRKDDYPLHARRAPTCGTATSSSTSIARARAARATARRRCPRSSAPWRMEDLRLGHRIVYDVKANWKLIVQNYNECLHCPNLHPALNKLSHYLSGENEPLQPTYMGGRMDLRPGVETMSMDGTCPRAFLPGLSTRRSAARLLLRDLPEHAAQPAPRLHAGAHALAARARPHDQRLRVALPAGGAARGPDSIRPTRSSSGT